MIGFKGFQNAAHIVRKLAGGKIVVNPRRHIIIWYCSMRTIGLQQGGISVCVMYIDFGVIIPIIQKILPPIGNAFAINGGDANETTVSFGQILIAYIAYGERLFLEYFPGGRAIIGECCLTQEFRRGVAQSRGRSFLVVNQKYPPDNA
ncbi:MAG: hypothetical protein J6X20_00390 [Bacteroidales bacterium]|nr:hypothetical protein [Bacteroidales bacterium]